MTAATPDLIRRLVVTLDCMHCGQNELEQVDTLAALGPLPRRCARCGGPVLVTSASVKRVRNANYTFDWDADAPKLGRPRKAARHVG